MTRLTAQQFAGFRRAVLRCSRGQVSIPDVVMTTGEAIALWRDIAAVFRARHRPGHIAASDTSRLLTAFEMAQLRQQAWSRSPAQANLSASGLSRDAGLAFWRIAVRLGELQSRRPTTPLARAASAAALGLAVTQMAACTSFFGNNIRGSFSCSAPGGTCAPSSVIDDQALSVIQNARPLSPAGPYYRAPARRELMVSARASIGRGRIAAAGEGMVHRERRVLKVVFPSYVDGAGNLHEPRVIHTVADEGGWMQLSSGAPNAGEQAALRNAAIASIPNVSVSAAAALQAEIASAATPSATNGNAALSTTSLSERGLSGTPDPADQPDPRVIAQARARGVLRTTPSPLDAIRAEVEARLAQTPKAAGSRAPLQVVPPLDPAPATGLQPGAQTRSVPRYANQPAGFSAKVEE